MNKATDLKNALLALFRSGADSEHDETEMEELLEDIDFSSPFSKVCFCNVFITY